MEELEETKLENSKIKKTWFNTESFSLLDVI